MKKVRFSKLYYKRKHTKYSEMYWAAYKRFIKDQNIKIRHKNVPLSYDGEYNAETKTIIVSSRLAGTFEGYSTLLHEWNHYRQHKTGRFKELFRDNPKAMLKWSKKKKINFIWRCEWSCYQFVRKELKKQNIDPDKHFTVRKSWVKKHILPIWIKTYKKDYSL